MEEEQAAEKPFDTVLIVLLLEIAVLSDVGDLATDLVAAVPVIGQVIYFGNSFLVSPIVWAILQGIFVMKTGGFKASSLVVMGGGLGNVINIPGSETITTIIAIVMANHPKLAGAAAQVGLAAATGGAGAVAGKAAAAGGKVAGAVEKGAAAGMRAEAVSAERAAAEAKPERALGTKPSERPTAEAKEAGAEAEGIPAAEGPPTPEVSEEAMGVEPTPFEKLQKLTTEPLPPKEKKSEGGEEDEGLPKAA